MNIAPQSTKEIEEREANGTITLNSLRAAANAMDMHLVYGFLVKKNKNRTTVSEKFIKDLNKRMYGKI